MIKRFLKWLMIVSYLLWVALAVITDPPQNIKVFVVGLIVPTTAAFALYWFYAGMIDKAAEGGVQKHKIGRDWFSSLSRRNRDTLDS